MTIYAHKGERVTCESGHVICVVARDLEVTDEWKPGDFVGWTQPEPPVGKPSNECACLRCGGQWFRGPAYFHFADGWR